MSRRLHPDARIESILDAALVLSRGGNYRGVTQDAIAAAAGCSKGLITHHFGTMNKLRRAIVSAAIVREDLAVLSQALAAREPKALAAPEELRRRAAEWLLA